MKIFIKIQFLLFALIFLASCTVGDLYQKPELAVEKNSGVKRQTHPQLFKKIGGPVLKTPILINWCPIRLQAATISKS